VFGNVHDFVKTTENNLSLIQNQIHIDGPSDNLLNLERNAKCELDKALEKQECYWHEKALDGDRNTTYFHRLSKIKIK